MAKGNVIKVKLLPDGAVTADKIANGAVTSDKLSQGVKDSITAVTVMTISPEQHANIFRGKNLGSTVTDAQKAAIRDGSFSDLFLGDYWETDDVKWRIVDMDYWYNTASTAFTTHHLVIMPDSCLYDYPMHGDTSTAGGYVGSHMYTSGLDEAKTTIAEVFGSTVLTHKEYLVNAATNGKPSGVALKDSTVELPSEVMMYGAHFYSQINDAAAFPNVNTFCKTQLALFRIAPKFIINREDYWLRDVASEGRFARMDIRGHTDSSYADAEYGVRPVFAIG